MTEPFRVGDVVCLSNPDTRYKLNGIPASHWGGEYTVAGVMGYGVGEVAAYWLDVKGIRRHVVHSMLSNVGGPW